MERGRLTGGAGTGEAKGNVWPWGRLVMLTAPLQMILAADPQRVPWARAGGGTS